MRRSTLALIAALALVVGAFAILGDTGELPPDNNVCHEDQACWDCTTMGNRTCGELHF